MGLWWSFLWVLPISFIVHGDYIHGDVILLMWIQTRNLHTHSGEHPAARKTKIILLQHSVIFNW